MSVRAQSAAPRVGLPASCHRASTNAKLIAADRRRTEPGKTWRYRASSRASPGSAIPARWLRPDLIAGLTAAAVVVPKAMAYATIAGLPLQVGLYTAIVPMVVYALLGTSRPLSVSTTTTIAILTAAELGRAAPGGDAAR